MRQNFRQPSGAVSLPWARSGPGKTMKLSEISLLENVHVVKLVARDDVSQRTDGDLRAIRLAAAERRLLIDRSQQGKRGTSHDLEPRCDFGEGKAIEPGVL